MATETLRPNAAGDSTQLTPNTGANWAAVDETPSDDDTTYVKSSATDDLPYFDLYNLPDTAIPAGSTINSVTVYMNTRSINATYKAYFRTALKVSGGSVQYGTQYAPGTSYTLYNESFAGVLQTDLNALQIGVEITSGYRSELLIYPGSCTQVYVVIDWSVGGARTDQFFQMF